MSASIIYWNRALQREETEQVYGERFVRWLYENPLGQKVADRFLTKRFLSQIYGLYQDSLLSKREIAPFIRKFRINMDEYEGGPFKSFNDFFIRKFRPGARTFEKSPEAMPAFAEGRYFAFDKVKPDQKYPVKGTHLSAQALLGSEKHTGPFIDGPLFIARLCPVDYHRFHYPDDGKAIDSFTIHGAYHSVNPLALKYKSEIFATNERHVSLLETGNFGKLAYIEVGALCVGKIVQTHAEDQPFRRSHEKGYFLFGASTIIVMGEPGRWKPDQDLLDQTANNSETLVRLGEKIASKK